MVKNASEIKGKMIYTILTHLLFDKMPININVI